MAQTPGTDHSSPARTSGAPIVHTLAVGALQANCYLVACPETQQAAIVDPGDEAERILAAVRNLGVSVTSIIHTHGHFDHISATEQVQAGLPGQVPLAAHPDDAYLYTEEAGAIASAFGYPVPARRTLPDVHLDDGGEIAVGTLRLTVLHTPGHTPGSISLHCAPWCVLSGDTLFRRGIGRTDLAGGDEDAIYTSISERLYTLDPALEVYPGHGSATTIDEERRLNPFVRADRHG